MTQIDILPISPVDAAARVLLREYLSEIVGRYHGRAITADELDAAVAEYTDDDLIMPRGVLLVAWTGSEAAGCAGIRMMSDLVGEIVRVFVGEGHRRRGIARALLAEVELFAQERGLRQLRLDTRHDLIESRALYAALGFQETEAHNAEPHAERWFTKPLPAPGSPAGRR